MTWALVAAVLAQAEPDAGVGEEPVDAGIVGAPLPAPAPVPVAVPVPVPVAAPEAGHWAVWGQPLGTAGYAAGGALSVMGSPSVPVLAYIPLGVNLVLPGLELVLEATVTVQVSSAFVPARLGGWVSAGPLWHTGPHPLNGFFVQPKLIAAYAASVGTAMCGGFCGQAPDQGLVALGVDVGYQFTFRHLYVAFVGGFGIGGGNYGNLQLVTPWASTAGGFPGTTGGLEPVLLVNLNLLRIGGWQ